MLPEMQKQSQINLLSVSQLNKKWLLVIHLFFLLGIQYNARSQTNRYHIKEYGLTFYFDSSETGVIKTIDGERYIQLFYCQKNLIKLICYSALDSTIMEKGEYIAESLPLVKSVNGRNIDTDSTLITNIEYIDLKRKGYWFFYKGKKIKKLFYE